MSTSKPSNLQNLSYLVTALRQMLFGKLSGLFPPSSGICMPGRGHKIGETLAMCLKAQARYLKEENKSRSTPESFLNPE